MTEKYIRLDDVMTIIARKHLFKDKTDFDKCVHAIAEQIKALPPVEAVPLSVIEEIHDAIDNADSDGFLINENGHMLAMTLTKEHINDIIDKAVKECTHETN